MTNKNLTMLLADYRNKADYAKRKQDEYQRASDAADAALELLEKESRKQGMVIGV